MADISSIKLPSGNTYDIKDSTARAGLGSKVNEPAVEGTSGQVLTTDGNGGRSWTTVPTVTKLSATIESADWTGSDPYTNAVTVTGLLATDNPVMDLVASSTYATAQTETEEYGYIYKATCSATNTLTVYATQAPTRDLSITLLCVR